jgi:two-component system response regulator RegA
MDYREKANLSWSARGPGALGDELPGAGVPWGRATPLSHGQGGPEPRARAGVDDRTVVIVDDEAAFAEALASSFRRLDYQPHVVADHAAARAVISHAGAALVVTELTVAGQSVFGVLPQLRELAPLCHVIIATARPSVATALRAGREGVDAYLAKPATAHLVLAALTARPQGGAAEEPWPSLDRTIWEYINQVLVTVGTVSGSARRLKLAPRSLRRMLAKNPPSQ